MLITQIDNRRIRRARVNYKNRVNNANDRSVPTFSTWDEIRTASTRFSWHLDQQSARIARRCGLKSFAGVPASYAIPK